MATKKEDTMFILGDVTEVEHKPPAEYLAELKRISWPGWAYYPIQKSISFSISRTSDLDVHDGNNLTRYANCIRRYINSRNEVLVLDFIPNHEQTTSEPVVFETGDPCLINEIRMALNGVLCRQVRGAIYELHAVNSTPGRMDVMTGHITRADYKDGDPWHGDFAPTVKLGQIEPGAELHIKMIYMLAGRVFTADLPVITGSEIKMPPDHTYFLHNGFAKFDQPDMVEKNKLIRNPLTASAKTVTLGLYPQPYIEPRDIILRAFEQLAEDFGILLDLVKKSRASLDTSGTCTFPRMSISIGDQNELLMRTHGFDESIGVVVASNAGFLDPTCTHNSAHIENIPMKVVIIRVTAEKPADLVTMAVELALARTADLIKQFGH